MPKKPSMTKPSRALSYPNCVVEVLQGHTQPLTVDRLMDEIGKMREVGSGGRSAVYRALKTIYQAVPVDGRRYGWLTNLLTGAVLRHPLTNQEMRRGYLLLDEMEHAVFFPEFFQNYTPVERKLMVQLFGGPVVTAVAYIENRTWSLRLGAAFTRWVEQVGGQGDDHLIIQVDDAPHGLFTMRLQPAEARDPDAIDMRNRQIALAAEEIVSADAGKAELVLTADIAARLIARGLYQDPVPPDELHYVLHRHARLRYVNDQGYVPDIESGVPADDIADAPDTRRFQAGLFSDLRDGGVPRDGGTQQGYEEPFDPDVEQAMRFLGWGDDHGTGQSLLDWLEQFAHEVDGDFPLHDELERDSDHGVVHGHFAEDDLAEDHFSVADEDEFCNAYLRYIERLAESDVALTPLSHHDFHLVAAELEYMLALEDEFGILLADQMDRKAELAARLLLDPNSLSNDDLDIPDYPDLDDPSYWE